jgi:hypothetical protein
MKYVNLLLRFWWCTYAGCASYRIYNLLVVAICPPPMVRPLYSPCHDKGGVGVDRISIIPISFLPTKAE